MNARAVDVPTDDGLFGSIRSKYDSLSDQGKFAAAAVTSFIGTRMILGSAMGAIKIGAAAFIA